MGIHVALSMSALFCTATLITRTGLWLYFDLSFDDVNLDASVVANSTNYSEGILLIGQWSILRRISNNNNSIMVNNSGWKTYMMWPYYYGVVGHLGNPNFNFKGYKFVPPPSIEDSVSLEPYIAKIVLIDLMIVPCMSREL